MTSSLVGSEMCIRDSPINAEEVLKVCKSFKEHTCRPSGLHPRHVGFAAVSYTHLTLPTICSV
eukprot:3603402-Prorocentrum_lima.AAC.1